MSRKDWGFSRKRSSVEHTRVWVELWSLAYNVASDTHEVVKHDNIREHIWLVQYGEESTQGVYVCINSISIVICEVD